MFIVLQAKPWTSLIIELAVDSKKHRVPLSVGPGKSIGYIPIYATREGALADHPGAELMDANVENKTVH
jgi:hypothetical protein